MIIVSKMKQILQIETSARLVSRVCSFSAMLGLAGLMAAQIVPGAAHAQDSSQRQSIFIDGSTPVDAHTRARVDAYFDEIENREQAKAEERTRFERFIYQDNSFGSQQVGRW